MLLRNRLFTAGFVTVGGVAGLYGWKESQKIKVNISSHFENAQISIAEAKVIDGNQPHWTPIKAGPIRLAKAAYYFKLVTPELERTGLIAINDETAVVLK